MKRPAWIGLLMLLFASTALYLPSLGADFVGDARAQILTDSFLYTPGHWLDIFSLRVLGQDVLDNNRPLHLLLLLIDARLWGKNPLGFHLTSILLHGACTVLVFIAGLRLGCSKRNAFLAALLFAVHPLNCEAVSEVSYREDLLSMLGITIALSLATFFTPERCLKNFASGTTCIAFLLLAVCAKENAIAGPLVLGAYWILYRWHQPHRGWLALIASAILITGAFLLARFGLQPKNSQIFLQQATYPGGSFLDTLLVVPRIWTSYIWRLFAPIDLCADYGPHSIRNVSLVLSLAALFVIVGLQISLSRGNPLFAIGSLIFWLSLLPVSNFIPIYRPMADRFLYLPLSGFALMMGSLLEQPRLRHPFWKSLFSIWIAVLAALTWERQKVWQNSLSLWNDTFKKNPVSTAAAVNLGTALLQANRPNEALEIFERAVRLGSYAESQSGLAVALDAAGRTREADAALRKAVTMDPLYKQPQKLVQSLMWEPDMAQRLQKIVSRNPDL